jgi:hypothetical protein
VATEALADGSLSRRDLMRSYTKVHRNVYARTDVELTALDRAQAARRIDMGWPEWMVGAEYDGEHHWTDPARHAEDIERLEFLAARGWTIVRVSARQLRYQSALVVERVRSALQRAGFPR